MSMKWIRIINKKLTENGGKIRRNDKIMVKTGGNVKNDNKQQE